MHRVYCSKREKINTWFVQLHHCCLSDHWYVVMFSKRWLRVKVRGLTGGLKTQVYDYISFYPYWATKINWLYRFRCCKNLGKKQNNNNNKHWSLCFWSWLLLFLYQIWWGSIVSVATPIIQENMVACPLMVSMNRSGPVMMLPAAREVSNVADIPGPKIYQYLDEL